MIKHFGKVALIALAAYATGCSSNGTPGGSDGVQGHETNDKQLGGVDFAFTAVPGLDISSIHYDVVDATTSVSVQTGTADVSNADAQAKAFVLLPPGSYVAHLTATGTQPCVGQTATFVVTAGGSITVSAALSCGTAVQIQKGTAYINATFNPQNTCGITQMFVGPLTQGNNSNITLESLATPFSTFAWTSSNAAAGTLNNANSANASLTCSGLGGQTTLTLTITDSHDVDCTDVQTVDVDCIPGGLCLNGTVNAPEQCDDGNTSNTDSCTNTCQTNVCGDGFVNTGVEACDDGNTNNLDACSNTCLVNVCGDGVVNNGETCDDGNAVDDGNGCSATCQSSTQVCGNGTVEAFGPTPEQCDDGNAVNTDACHNNCTSNVQVCGNGTVEAFGATPEQCDDGNTAPNDGCSPTCQTGAVVFTGGCVSQAGKDCTAASCGAELALCDAAGPLCRAVMNCMYDVSKGSCATIHAQNPTSAGIDACFCGIGSDAAVCYINGQLGNGGNGGPCVAEIQAAAAPTTGNLSISQLYYDNNADPEIGNAGNLYYCQSTACAASCGY